ncbi:MAG: hypothetical protein AABX73_00910 [Nanoarchaeota archaeon]
MNNPDSYVEAIEEGRIIKVSEDYAKREGLTILKKLTTEQLKEKLLSPYSNNKIKKLEKEDRRSFLDNLRKPLSWKEKQVILELVDNFNWRISTERKRRGISRKQLAQIIQEDEYSIKELEYGRLPLNDFVLINKIQTALGINLRKDGKNFNAPIKDMFSSEQNKIEEKEEIEILDEEV